MRIDDLPAWHLTASGKSVRSAAQHNVQRCKAMQLSSCVTISKERHVSADDVCTLVVLTAIG